MMVEQITSRTANQLVIEHHYLHRKTSISYAYGLHDDGHLAGVVTFGIPPSRHLQKSAKVKYWTTTGNRTERKTLESLCNWPKYNWQTLPPPCPEEGQL